MFALGSGGVSDSNWKPGCSASYVEEDFRANRQPSRDRRIGRDGGKPKPLRQRIAKIMIVEDVHARHSKACVLAVKVNFDRVIRYRDHPEYVVAVNMHVVVMDLLIDAGRSNRTGV